MAPIFPSYTCKIMIACCFLLVYIGLLQHACFVLLKYASLTNLSTSCLSLCAGNALRSLLKVRPNCRGLMSDQTRMKRTSYMPTRIMRKMKGQDLIYPSRTRNSRTRLTKFTCMSTTLAEWRYLFSFEYFSPGCIV